MNYKGIVNRTIASSPELKKNVCLAQIRLFTLGIRKKQSKILNVAFEPLEIVRRVSRGSAPTSTTVLTQEFLYFRSSYHLLRKPFGVRNASIAKIGMQRRYGSYQYPFGACGAGYAGQYGLNCFHAEGRKPCGLATFCLQPYPFTPKGYWVLVARPQGIRRNRNRVLQTLLKATWGTEAVSQSETQFSGVGSCEAIPEVEESSKQVKKFDQNTTDSFWDQKRPTYPFTAIVGQEEMKLALLLNVIDPKIGGVMIMGDRGTGKSTTVRALIDLLPTIEVVDNDPFNSHPSDAELMSQNVREQVLQGKSLKIIKKKTQMIDLPLGATEDRVCGTIDIERALSEGVKAFEPGLLAKANRGILYVDEVNLLDDHLVDILLDSAASGWNTVEREGISISHPARFILVGSGNPEEGELRPQLLDRFGMHAQIGTVREAELRVKIVEERANFDRSPIDFLALHIKKQKELADKIVAARHLLGAVKIDYDLRVKISQVCGQLNVDGLRGDIVTNRASQALAAFEARTSVTPQDIFRVIPLCLRHRLRKDPLEPIDSGNRVREVFKQVFGFMSE